MELETLSPGPAAVSDGMRRHDVVIGGGGGAGIAVAASLKARKPDLDIAIVDPADIHYYQPGWTMVGAGVFSPAQTAKTMASLIPKGVRWMFSVKDYVPPLMQYIERYGIDLRFQHTLTRIDGPAKRAWFTRTDADGSKTEVETDFDMIHVVPPQVAPDFLRVSPLADAAGWIDVDPASLRHNTHESVYGLGDAGNTPNAKTAAAARKQAPIVAHNLLKDIGALRSADAAYDGYGACPLTVDRGKIVLAEFGYAGKLLPSFPSWLIDGQQPSRLAWMLKERMLPLLYWKAMLQGREWMASPELVA